MTPPAPDTKIRVPLPRQAWCMVTFVYWRYDASVPQPMLAPGLTVDQQDGSAWATLVALEMRDVRLLRRGRRRGVRRRAPGGAVHRRLTGLRM